MKIKPTGYFVLIEVEPVKETYNDSVIVMAESERKREFGGRDIGKVLAFGPTAYAGFEGCSNHTEWGVEVGDTVEFNKYDGKVPRVAELDDSLANCRILKDSDIIAVVEK